MLHSNKLIIDYYIIKLYSYKRILSIYSINYEKGNLRLDNMTDKNQKIIVFITGTSGVGKSVLVPLLKIHLPSFDVRDFDELGVPEDVDINWRLETTDYWLKQAKENLENNESTIICGTSLPDEVFRSCIYSKEMNIRFGLLKTTESTIQERLAERNWDQKSINEYKKWQKTLEDLVMQTKNHIILNGEQALQKIVEDIRLWIHQ